MIQTDARGHFLDHRQITRELERMFAQAQCVRLVRLRNKGESLLARFCLENDTAKEYVWVKINKVFFSDPEKARHIAEESYKTLQELQHKFSDDPLLGITEACGYIPAWAALVTKEAEGIPLSKAMYSSIVTFPIAGRRQKRSIDDIVSRCGLWLARLHEITMNRHGVPGHDPDFLQPASIEEDLAKLKALGVKDEIIAAVRGYFLKHRNSLRQLSCPEVGCHVDFSPRNIIVAKNGRITLLDFEKFSSRWPYDNLAIFLVYLESLRKYAFVNRGRLRQLKSLFLEGYRRKSVFPVDDGVLSFFEARYMVMMIANELAFLKKRRGLKRFFMTRRMVRLFETWIEKNIKP